jgi:ankyrin repeat protein
MAALKHAACCCSATRTQRRGTKSTSLPLLSHLILINCFVSLSQDTPLHVSARQGRLQICRLLLASNANVAATNRYAILLPPYFTHLRPSDGKTALDYAIEENEADVAACLRRV